MRAAFIGFSEAGPAFAEAMITRGAEVRAFDLRSLDPETAPEQRRLCARVGAAHSGSLAAAVEGAGLVISTVTAAAALPVAREAAIHLTGAQVYLDLNSVAPGTKLAVRDALAATGARVVEGVAMGRIAEGRLPPVLMSGPHAADLAPRLAALGWDARDVGPDWGAAPAAKMLRSVMVKGFEALLVEAFAAADAAGAADPLLGTLSDWLPGIDWASLVPYHRGRVRRHGARRAAELEECARFLEALGVPAPTTRAAARTQADWSGRPDPRASEA